MSEEEVFGFFFTKHKGKVSEHIFDFDHMHSKGTYDDYDTLLRLTLHHFGNFNKEKLMEEQKNKYKDKRGVFIAIITLEEAIGLKKANFLYKFLPKNESNFEKVTNDKAASSLTDLYDPADQFVLMFFIQKPNSVEKCYTKSAVFTCSI